MTEWYYIGHYGRLGPLNREQVDELVEGGVITAETYVWHAGLPDWLTADRVNELAPTLRQAAPFVAPPPPPMASRPPAAPAPFANPTPMASPMGQPTYPYQPSVYGPPGRMVSQPYSIQSNKSRVLAGVLNMIIPGGGRMYLGYLAYGVMMLLLTICSFGTLWIWSIIDGVFMLTGGLKHDGYGRVLAD